MNNTYTLDEAQKLILSGEKLFISGDQQMLAKLPKGNWIGGSIPYFMTSKGGLFSKDVLLVQSLPTEVEEIKIMKYSTKTISHFPQDSFANGFSFILIPGGSELQQIYAKECWNWSRFFDHPILGWITGHDLNDKAGGLPVVVNGQTGDILTSEAIVLHARLKSDCFAKVDIINIFKQGKGDTIQFSKSDFEVQDCIINGEKKNFVDYFQQNKINQKLPLVASYMGTNINVSIKEFNTEKKKVSFFAPVFENVDYRVAEDVPDYESSFLNELKDKKNTPFFSCNCILNYLYANLEGKKLGEFSGPMTFGEVAYMLLNQTFVYVTIEKK